MRGDYTVDHALRDTTMTELSDYQRLVERPFLKAQAERIQAISNVADALERENDELRKVLARAVEALTEAEAVVDADDQPETWNKISAVRKMAAAAL